MWRVTPAELVTAVALSLAGRWLWHATFHPFAPCRRCKGRKTNRGSTRARFGSCWRCGGSGTRQVIGSAYVHKVLRTARGLGEKRKAGK